MLVWPRNIMIDDLRQTSRTEKMAIRKCEWSACARAEQIINKLTTCRDRSDARLNSFSCRDAMER